MYLSNQPAFRKHRFRGHFFIVCFALTAWFDSIDRMNISKRNRSASFPMHFVNRF